MQKITVQTISVSQTQALAESIGRTLRGGEVIELASDLGGGKTTFAKGLAKGLEITEVVQSPTFTISRIYPARDGLELHHFDFYRLNEPGLMAAEIGESLNEPGVVIIVEWGDVMRGVLPEKRLDIGIKNQGESMRELEFSIPEEYAYLIPAIEDFKVKPNDFNYSHR